MRASPSPSSLVPSWCLLAVLLIVCSLCLVVHGDQATLHATTNVRAPFSLQRFIANTKFFVDVGSSGTRMYLVNNNEELMDCGKEAPPVVFRRPVKAMYALLRDMYKSCITGDNDAMSYVKMSLADWEQNLVPWFSSVSIIYMSTAGTRIKLNEPKLRETGDIWGPLKEADRFLRPNGSVQATVIGGQWEGYFGLLAAKDGLNDYKNLDRSLKSFEKLVYIEVGGASQQVAFFKCGAHAVALADSVASLAKRSSIAQNKQVPALPSKIMDIIRQVITRPDQQGYQKTPPLGSFLETSTSASATAASEASSSSDSYPSFLQVKGDVLVHASSSQDRPLVAYSKSILGDGLNRISAHALLFVVQNAPDNSRASNPCLGEDVRIAREAGRFCISWNSENPNPLASFRSSSSSSPSSSSSSSLPSSSSASSSASSSKPDLSSSKPAPKSKSYFYCSDDSLSFVKDIVDSDNPGLVDAFMKRNITVLGTGNVKKCASLIRDVFYTMRDEHANPLPYLQEFSVARSAIQECSPNLRLIGIDMKPLVNLPQFANGLFLNTKPLLLNDLYTLDFSTPKTSKYHFAWPAAPALLDNLFDQLGLRDITPPAQFIPFDVEWLQGAAEVMRFVRKPSERVRFANTIRFVPNIGERFDPEDQFAAATL